jgi:hypothetical protein
LEGETELKDSWCNSNSWYEVKEIEWSSWK